MSQVNWDGTIGLTDVAIVIAAVLGPVLAVQAQKWLERRRDVKEKRLTIFRTLMATRAAMLSPQHVEALNAVPVEFYGSGGALKKINDAWKLYLDHHDERLQWSEAWAQKRHDLFLDMLHLISQFLGYKFSRAQLGRDIYLPKAHGDLETEQAIIRKGLVGLFKGEITLPMAVKEFPHVDPSAADQQAPPQQIPNEAVQRTSPLDSSADKSEGN